MADRKKNPMCAHLAAMKPHEIHGIPDNDAPLRIDVMMLSVEEVQKIVGVSRASIYAWMKVDKFPKCKKLSRSSRWLSTEVYAWIADLKTGVQA